MKKNSVTLFTVIFLIVVAVGVHRMSVDSFASRARTLRVGDSKKKVEQLLGRPTIIFIPKGDILFSVSEETWAYGSSFDFSKAFNPKFPYISPNRLIRWRFFIPDAEDIAIRFDSVGGVSGITIP